MPSIHFEFEKEDIASIVLMPGDPLRAKYIAEKYLTNYKLINQVRNMLGYTGYYQGEKISIVASGMGIPSMGLYAYELFSYYDVSKIIRIGTCGSMNQNVKVNDILLAESSYSESSFAYLYNNSTSKIFMASSLINQCIIDTAKEKDIKIKPGAIYCTDVFEPYAPQNIIKNLLPNNMSFLASEMESFALFFIASLLNKEAACILTVSDSPYENKALSSQERQSSLDEMIKIVLDSVHKI